MLEQWFVAAVVVLLFVVEQVQELTLVLSKRFQLPKPNTFTQIKCYWQRHLSLFSLKNSLNCRINHFGKNRLFCKIFIYISLFRRYRIRNKHDATSVVRPKKKCGFPVSSYKNLGRVGRF
jgi:hypothetical protein